MELKDMSHSTDLALYHTTFDELHEYALEHIKDTYESLPSPKTLDFERMVNLETGKSYPCNPNLVPIRLVLGYMYAQAGRERSKVGVYAHIFKKDGITKTFLRLGDKPLVAKYLDHVNFRSPFDAIYDSYGMTEKAIARIGMMAGYYFLATGHVDSIITLSDCKVAFTAMCFKIWVQHGTGPEQSEHAIGTAGPSEPSPHANIARPLLNLATSLAEGGLALGDEDAHTSDNTAVAKSKSKTEPSDDETTANEQSNSEHSSTTVTEPTELLAKSSDIDDDLASFINAHKALKAENAALIAKNSKADRLHAQLFASQLAQQDAINTAQIMRTELTAKVAQIANLDKKLQQVRVKGEEDNKNFVSARYNLGLQEVKSRTYEMALAAAEKPIQDQDNEIKESRLAKESLEKRLEEVASQDNLEQEVQDLKTANERLGVDNESLKRQIDVMEKELRKTTDKFVDYRKKIKAVVGL